MSSGGVTVADGGPQLYFCHQCDHTVNISPSPGGDLFCPTCNSGFVEEFENPNPNPIVPDPFFPDPLSLFLSQFLNSSPNPIRRSGSVPAVGSPVITDVFDPISYVMNLLADRRASGTEDQFIIDEGHGSSGFSLSANLGDYFVGPGFEQLIQQLAENDPNRYGTPPASKSALEALPSIKVDGGLFKSELAQCAVCKDDFEMETMVKQMPCKHVYHEECILPWLELHNSCPVCRYELPTDDQDYENISDGSGNSTGNGSNNNDSSLSNDLGEGSEGERIVERRFTITLPWFFGGLGSGSGPSGGSSDEQHRDSN